MAMYSTLVGLCVVWCDVITGFSLAGDFRLTLEETKKLSAIHNGNRCVLQLLYL